MAECLRARVENITECIICFERYSKEHVPKILFCGHQMCKICLEGLVSLDESIECPECKQETRLPSGGIRDLPTNISILGLAEKLEESTLDPTERQADREDGLSSPEHKCSECKQNYEGSAQICEPCKCAVCLSCFILHHSNHTASLEKDYHDLCRSLANKRSVVEQCIAEERNKIAQIENSTKMLERNKEEIQKRIKEDAIKCIDFIRGWEQTLFVEVVNKFEGQCAKLLSKKADVEIRLQTLEDKFESSQILSQDILNNNDKSTVLRDWQQDLLQMVDDIIAFNANSPTVVPAEGGIQYTPLQERLRFDNYKFGQLSSGGRLVTASTTEQSQPLPFPLIPSLPPPVGRERPRQTASQVQPVVPPAAQTSPQQEDVDVLEASGRLTQSLDDLTSFLQDIPPESSPPPPVPSRLLKLPPRRPPATTSQPQSSGQLGMQPNLTQSLSDLSVHSPNRFQWPLSPVPHVERSAQALPRAHNPQTGPIITVPELEAEVPPPLPPPRCRNSFPPAPIPIQRQKKPAAPLPPPQRTRSGTDPATSSPARLRPVRPAPPPPAPRPRSQNSSDDTATNLI